MRIKYIAHTALIALLLLPCICGAVESQKDKARIVVHCSVEKGIVNHKVFGNNFVGYDSVPPGFLDYRNWCLRRLKESDITPFYSVELLLQSKLEVFLAE